MSDLKDLLPEIFTDSETEYDIDSSEAYEYVINNKQEGGHLWNKKKKPRRHRPDTNIDRETHRRLHALIKDEQKRIKKKTKVDLEEQQESLGKELKKKLEEAQEENEDSVRKLTKEIKNEIDNVGENNKEDLKRSRELLERRLEGIKQDLIDEMSNHIEKRHGDNYVPVSQNIRQKNDTSSNPGVRRKIQTQGKRRVRKDDGLWEKIKRFFTGDKQKKRVARHGPAPKPLQSNTDLVKEISEKNRLIRNQLKDEIKRTKVELNEAKKERNEILTNQKLEREKNKLDSIKKDQDINEERRNVNNFIGKTVSELESFKRKESQLKKKELDLKMMDEKAYEEFAKTHNDLLVNYPDEYKGGLPMCISEKGPVIKPCQDSKGNIRVPK